MGVLQKLAKPISYISIVRIKNKILFILDKIGLNEIFALKNKNKLIILFYHGITQHENYLNPYHISKSMFEKQISYLKKNNYTFLTLSDWIKIKENEKKSNRRYIVITFDDGYNNVIENALPILKKYCAKGCFYVVSDLIGKNQILWADYIEIFFRNYKEKKFKFHFKNQQINYPLNSENHINKAILDIQSKLLSISNIERQSHLKQFNKYNKSNRLEKVPKDYLLAKWEDIKLIDNKTIEIGSHSKTHSNLTTLNNKEELYRELYESKVKIEQELGISIKHLCYPHGFYNSKVVEQVKKCGYLTGVTGNRGFNTMETDLFQLKRLMGYNDIFLFKANTSGLYPFLKKILKFAF